MPRLVRRKPLTERLAAVLNPIDFLLWLSEELETRDWDSNVVGTQLGLGLNFVFLLARANSGAATPSDDIFRDDNGGGWLALLIHPLVWFLAMFSCANAFYAVTRSRKYRLFEANVEEKPSTPSARRVKIQSAPGSGSPLRYIASMVAPETASSRAHPNKATDVWELSVWDPLPVSIRLVCFFSPGHMLAYLISVPLAPLDPRPSVTVFNALLVQAVLSAQLLLFSSLYTQQAKDQSIVQKEVLHEYDTKFVRPRLHPVVRDVGTQFTDDDGEQQEFVQVGTPTTLIRHSFHTRQNPHLGTENVFKGHENTMSPKMFTPPNPTRRADSLGNVSTSRHSTSRQSMPAAYATAATSTSGFQSSYTPESNNFGGSMGVHTHNQSPLKKATSLNDINATEQPSPRNSREMASYEQRNYRRQSSPVKIDNRAMSRPNPFIPTSKSRPQYERYPSRR